MSNGKGPIHERFALIFLFVGFGLFAFGTFWQAVSPWLSMRHIPYEKMEDLAKNINPEFVTLARDYPVEFKQYYGEYGEAAFIDALETGKKAYIAEACWHCHSQYVRPVSRRRSATARSPILQSTRMRCICLSCLVPGVSGLIYPGNRGYIPMIGMSPILKMPQV